MNMDYEKQVGQKIRAIRRKCGLTQDQLAAKLQTHGCDMTRSALAKTEAGQRHLYVDELKWLAEILKAEYQDILL